MATRSDLHRPGALIPADYSIITTYAMPRPYGDDDWFEGYGMEEVGEAEASGAPTFGYAGKCGSCGAHFRIGALFLHNPTGELLHVGRDCAEKMALFANFSQAELANERGLSLSKAALLKKHNAKARADFLALHPGLAEILENGAHKIIRDMAQKFQRWLSLSDAQVALAFKLDDDMKRREAMEGEAFGEIAPWVAGRQKITAQVLTVREEKDIFSPYGGVILKALLMTGEGRKLWIKLPIALWEATRGSVVTMAIEIQPKEGEETFAFGKRPTKASFASFVSTLIPMET